MVGMSRVFLLALVGLAAGLVVACVCPGVESVHAPAPAPDAARDADRPRPTPLSITGVVRDEQGRPIPFVWIEVEGFPATLRSPPPWRTDVHGRFQTDDVPAGPATLLVTVGARPGTTPTKVVKTKAGARDLSIVLDPGPQLFVRIVDYVPGEQERYARVTWAEPDGARRIRYAPIRADGRARFVALPPDRAFELWAEAELDRRHVRARGLEPGPTEHRVDRHEVRSIAGSVRGSKARLDQTDAQSVGPLRERLRVVVFASAPRGHPFRDFRVAETRVQEDGSFRIHGLPAGTYEVEVGTGTGEVLWVSKTVETGTMDVLFDL